MNLRKNAGLKLGAAIAAVVTLISGWVLVHSNPPADATSASDTPATGAAQPPATTNQRAPARSGTSSNTTRTQPRTHTRTRAS